MRIAVIGSGISGLSVAHLLSKKHQVDLFEKENHFGGHSYTVEVPTENTDEFISIDLGFIVFNKINYPNLVKLFEKLQEISTSHEEYTNLMECKDAQEADELFNPNPLTA